MFVVGITGGIGSGKTAVTNLFAELGITIVDADIASRIIVEPGKPALAEIAERFGADMLQADGTLNRAAMRKRVFANPDDKRALERITHPRIGDEIRRQLREARSPYVILVSPLLIEGDQHQLCQRILVVDVPESVQLQRTMQRDSNDAEQVKRIIASQASREQRLARADDVIENTGTLDDLRTQVAALHQRYLALATVTGKDGARSED
jgi:dephospho-CoA kinase